MDGLAELDIEKRHEQKRGWQQQASRRGYLTPNASWLASEAT